MSTLHLQVTALRTRHSLRRQRQFASSLECSRIETLHLHKTNLRTKLRKIPYQYLEILLPMLNLKRLKLFILEHADDDEEFYHVVGAFVAAQPGTLEHLTLWLTPPSRPSSLAGLVPAMLRLTRFEITCNTSWDAVLHDLSDLVGDCDSVQNFFCHMKNCNTPFPAICQLASRFPSLKRVQFLRATRASFVEHVMQEVASAILDMVNTSKSIEVVDGWPFCNETQKTAIRAKCCTNRSQNFWKFCRDNGVLTNRMPTSVWPLILHKYSAEVKPDIIFYLLQEMHATIISTQSTQLA